MLFLWLFFFLSAGESFNFFKVWTAHQNLKIWSDYVRLSQIETPVVGGVLAQLKVWNGIMYSKRATGSSFDANLTAESLVNTDILTLMDTSSDPNAVMNLHIAQSKQSLLDMQWNYDQLIELSQQKQEESNDCLTDKRAGDQEFFAWVQEENESKWKQGLDASLEYAPCYITNRIEANAYAYLAQQVTAYYAVLDQRTNTLENNREQLVSSYPLLQWSVAEDLVWLKRTLNTVNTPSFANLEKVFSFGIPWASWWGWVEYPSLNNVWFSDNNLKIPTFIDPIQGLKAQ